MSVCSRPSVMLFGDSITQFSFSREQRGWGAGLADWYQRSADVFNRGFGGYNSSYGLCALKKHVLTPHLKLAIVCFGANDAVQEGGGESGENLHVPLHVFRTNLEGIISALRAHSPSVHVVLITPPTVDATLWPNRTPQRTAAYAQVVREVGNAVNTNHNSCRQSHHVRVLDLWAAGETECVGKGKEGREGGSEAVNLSDLCDGIHLAPSGNDKVLRGLQALIRTFFPACVPEDPMCDSSFSAASTSTRFPELCTSSLITTSDSITASATTCSSAAATATNSTATPLLPCHLPKWSVLQGKSKEEYTQLLNNWEF